jgi:DNA-binding protein Alba
MSNNVIYIGKKPIINYCQAIIQTLHNNDTAILLARGSSISRAVDALEVTQNRYLNGVKIKSIKLGTEKLRAPNNLIRNLSTMPSLLKSKI